MNNQDQDTRFQRYDFTPKRSQVKRKRRPPVWPWILGLIIVVLVLTFGIRYALNNSNQVTNQASKAPTTSKNTSTSKNSSNVSPKASQSTPTKATPAPVTQPTKATNSANNADNEDGFAETHTFNSLQDAKDWANATKSDWTAAGYNYWTVNQNSQGYYVLTFTK